MMKRRRKARPQGPEGLRKGRTQLFVNLSVKDPQVAAGLTSPMQLAAPLVPRTALSVSTTAGCRVPGSGCCPRFPKLLHARCKPEAASVLGSDLKAVRPPNLAYVFRGCRFDATVLNWEYDMQLVLARLACSHSHPSVMS